MRYLRFWFKGTREKSHRYLLACFLLASGSIYAAKRVELDDDGGVFSPIAVFMQLIIDFAQGTLILFIGFIGFCMLAYSVIFPEAKGVLTNGIRVIVGVALLFAAGSILEYFS